MAYFNRKEVLEKNYEVDLNPLYEIQDCLKCVTDYFYQVSKQTNQTGVIYKKDVDQMRAMTDELKKRVGDVYNILRR